MKGPIFHKILYKLSREQRRRFLGEESRLDRAVVAYSLLNRAVERSVWCCDDCNRKFRQNEEGVKENDIIKSSGHCGSCGREMEFLVVEFVLPPFQDESVEFIDPADKTTLVGKVNDVLARIRAIPEEQSICNDGYFSEEVSLLLDKLLGFLDQIVQKWTRGFRRLQKTVFFSKPIRDLRKQHRSLSAFLFKNLPDFSGCEDEFGLTQLTVKQISSSFNKAPICVTIRNHCLPRSILLSNLLNSG